MKNLQGVTGRNKAFSDQQGGCWTVHLQQLVTGQWGEWEGVHVQLSAHGAPCIVSHREQQPAAHRNLSSPTHSRNQGAEPKGNRRNRTEGSTADRSVTKASPAKSRQLSHTVPYVTDTEHLWLPYFTHHVSCSSRTPSSLKNTAGPAEPCYVCGSVWQSRGCLFQPHCRLS